jgi:hypothetical protein
MATDDFVPVANWSLIESYTAVFCVSMLAMRPLFNRVLYTCFGILVFPTRIMPAQKHMREARVCSV